MVERHLVSRASKSLFQPSLAPLVPSTVEKLRALHPPAAVPASSLPSLPESSPRIHVDGKVLADLVKGKVANGSSPGPSGWTGELLLALTGDPDCLAGIVALVEDIINGLLDDRARSVLLASTLIATEKEAGGVRPIAIGEVFYRVACQYVLHLVRPQVPGLLEPIQFAHSVGGCERAIHVLQAALEKESLDSVLLSVDFSNAFNCPRRDVLFSRTFAVPQLSPLWRLVHWAYRSPSDLLLVRSGELVDSLSSAEGVRQGDALSSLLFSVSMHPLYSDAVGSAPGLTGVAFMDDFSLVGPHSSVFTALDRLSVLCPSYGPLLQRRKCAMLWGRSSAVPLAVSDGCTSRSLPLVGDGHPILGSMVSLSPDYHRDWLLKRVSDSHSRFFTFLGDTRLLSHHSFVLLRSSGLPRLSFLSLLRFCFLLLSGLTLRSEAFSLSGFV